jgi:hypothetical protein
VAGNTDVARAVRETTLLLEIDEVRERAVIAWH